MIPVFLAPQQGGGVKYFYYDLEIFILTINNDNRRSNGTNSPFHILWDDSFSDPGDRWISHRVRYGLTICWGRIRLIGDDINLEESECHSWFRSQSRKEALMPHQIGLGCSSWEYNSSTCDGVKIGGVVAKKLASLFHNPSKNHTVR